MRHKNGTPQEFWLCVDHKGKIEQGRNTVVVAISPQSSEGFAFVIAWRCR